MALTDFGYMTMDEIKVLAVEDRLKKFDGNQQKAADSLQIHVNSIANILNRGADKPKTDPQKKTAQANKDFDTFSREGFTTDPNTGLSVPQKPTPIPGIENIAKETFENAKKRNAEREKQGEIHSRPTVPAVPGAQTSKAPAKGK